MIKKLLGILLVVATLLSCTTAFAVNEKGPSKQGATKSVVLKDITKKDWFYQSVSWAVESGIMEADGGKFSPNKTAIRKDIIFALYQYAKNIGVDVSTGQECNVLSFEDGVTIPESKYAAFQWACSIGLIGKSGETKLLPNEELTRQSMIKLLYDFAVSMKQDVSVGENTNILSYQDVGNIAEGNFEAFQWACGSGIIGGTDNTILNPLSKATRAQLAVVLMRFDKLPISSTVSQKDMNYDLVKETYSKNKITIHYPQISNLSDSANQNKLNEILKNDALKQLNNYEEWALAMDKPYEESIGASIDYEVKWKGVNLLSIAYSGYSTLNNERSERNYHTVNLNLNTGEVLRLKDFINIDQSFIDKFITKKFKSKNSLFPNSNKPISDEVYQSLNFLYQINSKPNYKNLQQYFEETDSLSNDNIVTSCNFSYITNHSLGISVIVSHASGNYAEFEIGLNEIKSNIKAGNEIWRDFPSIMQAEK